MFQCQVSYFVVRVEFLTNDPQYKNANIADFVLVVLLEMNQTNVQTWKCNIILPTDI